ncbi:MAG: hypothetical protein ACJASU_000116 [Cognaticolwellia sp.]|jgi:hypothetical protein
MKTLNLDRYMELTDQHKANCKLYSYYIDSLTLPSKITTLADLPFLPVRAFKEFDLLSVAETEVFKVMLSSGTSGKQSKIYLDKHTAKQQSKGLTDSFKEYFGSGRFPMLIIDSENTARGRTARTAAVNGFSLYGKKRCFALDSNMELKLQEVQDFIKKHEGQKIFIFGFTFMLYQYLIQPLKKSGIKLDLSNSFILHGGGWKKLVNLNISDNNFKSMLKEYTGCGAVHNYYGMIEQTGSISFECENGHIHAPSNGDVLIRNFQTFDVNKYGEEGIIQVCSTIQESYPGHSLLTEDVGILYPASQCTCGRKGDILVIKGRLQSAEIRGCSDAV